MTFLDPSDDLLNAHLELVVAGMNESARCPMRVRSSTSRSMTATSRAIGSKAWAETVGRRLTLLLDGNPAVPTGKH